MRAEKRGPQDFDIIWLKVKAMVVFPVPAIPLSQYIYIRISGVGCPSYKIGLILHYMLRDLLGEGCSTMHSKRENKSSASRHQRRKDSLRSSPNFMRISPNLKCNIHLSMSMAWYRMS